MKDSQRRSRADEAEAQLRAHLEDRTDLELKAIVTVERDTYEPDAVRVAGEILAARGVEIPTPGEYRAERRRYEKENEDVLKRIAKPGRSPARRWSPGRILLKLLGLAIGSSID